MPRNSGLLVDLNSPNVSPIELAIDSYFSAVDRREEKERAKKQQAMDMKSKGLIETPDGGFDYDPETKAQREQALAQKTQSQQMGLLDKGMQVNDTGSVELSPESIQAKALERRYKAAQAAKFEHDAAAPYSAGNRGNNTPGGKLIPAGEVSNFSGANSAIQQLQDYEKTLQDNSDITGAGVGNSLNRGKAKLGAFFSGGNDISNRSNALQASQAKIAQVIGTYLEGGKLTDADTAKYVKMLPTITDNPEVARAKSSQLQKLISSRQAEQKQAFGAAGYNSGNLKTTEADTSGLGLLHSAPKGLIPNKVRVSNGQETLEIDESDLADAIRDGFKRL